MHNKRLIKHHVKLESKAPREDRVIDAETID